MEKVSATWRVGSVEQQDSSRQMTRLRTTRLVMWRELFQQAQQQPTINSLR